MNESQFYHKLLKKLEKIKSGDLNLDDYIKEVSKKAGHGNRYFIVTLVGHNVTINAALEHIGQSYLCRNVVLKKFRELHQVKSNLTITNIIEISEAEYIDYTKE